MDEAAGVPKQASNQNLPQLFASAPAGLEPAKVYPEEVRARALVIDPALLADDGSSLSGTQRFIINLFDDVSFVAEVDRADVQEPGRFTLNGHLEGVDGSYFILTYSLGTLSATVSHPSRGYYEIEPTGDATLKVSEFEPGKLPRLQHGMIYPDGMEMHDHMDSSMPVPLMKTAAITSIIDIMVVYTAAAVTGAGGDAAMRARIDKAVAEINTAFTNSKINTSVKLVRAQQINYGESGNLGTDLSRLAGTTDGYMDDVHALRSTYKADLVSLIVEKTGTGLAGIGYVQTPVGSGFKNYAFTVIGRQYAGSYNTLAHEVGHNMGCAHDRLNSSSAGAYPYSYGYRFTANSVQYRTIMAYAPGTLIPYFSNPNVSYLGAPTGIADGQTNSADNARTINNTSATVQAFFAGSVVKNALLVVGNTTLTTADLAISNRLKTLGFSVTAKTGIAAVAADASGKKLVFISSTIASTDVNTKFRTSTVPVISCENALQDDFAMTATTSGSFATTATQTQVAMTTTVHPISSGLTGTQTMVTSADTFGWGKPASGAAKLATQIGDATKVTAYSYEKGVAMVGLTAPARRVQLFLTDGTAAKMTSAGWKMFDQAVKWAAP
jgi:hypothetical protein